MRHRFVILAIVASTAIPASSASAVTAANALRPVGSICVTCKKAPAKGVWRYAFPGIKWVRGPGGVWIRRAAPRRYIWR